MMKTSLFIFLLGMGQYLLAQTTLTLQPNGDDGKDATIDSRLPDTNNGSAQDYIAHAWTFSGTPTDGRSLIEFDLDLLPEWAEVISAKLYLYGYDSPFNNGHESAEEDGNACYLRRITSPWNENTVTWNTQPTTTTVNELVISSTPLPNLDYVLDVTALIKDMLLYPEEGFGLMMQLIVEERYNSMLFGSSDNVNPALRPKLEIVYDRGQSSISEDQIDFSLYPNPIAEWLTIEFPNYPEDTHIRIYSSIGQLLISRDNIGQLTTINTSELPTGTYILRLQSAGGVLNRKIVISS